MDIDLTKKNINLPETITYSEYENFSNNIFKHFPYHFAFIDLEHNFYYDGSRISNKKCFEVFKGLSTLCKDKKIGLCALRLAGEVNKSFQITYDKIINNEIISYAVKVIPVKKSEDDKTIVGILTFIEDITEDITRIKELTTLQIELRDEKEFLSESIDNIPAMFIMIAEDGKVLKVNSEYISFLIRNDYFVEPYVSGNFFENNVNNLSDKSKKGIKKVLECREVEYKEEVCCNGNHYLMLVTKAGDFGIVLYIDIHERKELEKKKDELIGKLETYLSFIKVCEEDKSNICENIYIRDKEKMRKFLGENTDIKRFSGTCKYCESIIRNK